MYSTCLFCHHSLGVNESVESFPVGSRLAFDARAGRLWVVCRRCSRWNLSALEERWEAIEECERLFRGTRLRMATENVGLARLADGTDLVRIGRTLRPEIAAWRYGDHLGRRRRRYLLYTGVGAALGLPIVASGAYTIVPGGMIILNIALGIHVRRARQRVVARAITGSGDSTFIRGKHTLSARLVAGNAGGDWRLRVQHDGGWSELDGADALRVAGRVLAWVNGAGGGQRTVRTAVQRLDSITDPARLFEEVSLNPQRERSRWARWSHGLDFFDNNPAGALRSLTATDRLALEMATHEESERHALQGELKALEAEWREAEEIAAIADSLLVPPQIEAMIHRRGTGVE